MALILSNASFRESDGLVKLIELYNRGSLTAHALSTELTMAASEITAFGNEIYVEVVEGKAGDKCFGIAVLPRPSATKMDLFFYIDKQLFSLLTPIQVLDALILMLGNYTRVTTEFAKFNAKTFDFDVDLVDALLEAIELYKISIETLLELPGVSENIKSAFICPHGLETIKHELETGRYTSEQARELVVIKNALPAKIFEAAEAIVKNKIGGPVEGRDDAIFGSKYSELPSVDMFYNKLKSVSDDSYPLYQPADIDPHYEPETNQ